MADEEHLIEEGGHPFVVTAHLVFKVCFLFCILDCLLFFFVLSQSNFNRSSLVPCTWYCVGLLKGLAPILVVGSVLVSRFVLFSCWLLIFG